MLRTLFERFVLRQWQTPALLLRYWDGQEQRVGQGDPAVTVTFHSPAVLRQILWNPSLGFGRAYTDGRLIIEGDLQALLRGIFGIGAQVHDTLLARSLNWLLHLVHGRWNAQSAEGNARFHYDIGNDFFRLWLDASMTYSCAYFRTEQEPLESAQTNKRELLCRKLDLQPGQTLLDVGCGWGALLFHAIERYGVHGVGITPSREQAAFIETEAKRRGLSDRLTLQVMDWRKLTGTYDRVVSVGMYEHVGRAHAPAFFQKWRSWLRPDGVSVLHTIGGMESVPPDPWIDENIFPGGYVPPLSALATHAAHSGLFVADVENLWRHYVLTLAAWARNYDAARDTIIRTRGERFFRTWWLYLNASQAAFATGRLCLWQLLLTPSKRATHPLTRDLWSLS